MYVHNIKSVVILLLSICIKSAVVSAEAMRMHADFFSQLYTVRYINYMLFI